VYIEIDGSHHETRKQWEDDIARQNRLTKAGWRPLRYDSDQVRAKGYISEIGALFVSGEDHSRFWRGDLPQNGKNART
jgi:very-short-patch-repair endonuclease